MHDITHSQRIATFSQLLFKALPSAICNVCMLQEFSHCIVSNVGILFPGIIHCKIAYVMAPCTFLFRKWRVNCILNVTSIRWPGHQSPCLQWSHHIKDNWHLKAAFPVFQWFGGHTVERVCKDLILLAQWGLREWKMVGLVNGNCAVLHLFGDYWR